jgi:hypothetical protein
MMNSVCSGYSHASNTQSKPVTAGNSDFSISNRRWTRIDADSQRNSRTGPSALLKSGAEDAALQTLREVQRANWRGGGRIPGCSDADDGAQGVARPINGFADLGPFRPNKLKLELQLGGAERSVSKPAKIAANLAKYRLIEAN